MSQQALSLENLNGGAAIELFELEFQRALDNIVDINTSPDAVRKVVIEVKIKPDKSRRTATSEVKVYSKLPTVKPHESFLFFERQGGEVVAYPDDPAQGSLGLGEPLEDGKTIDFNDAAPGVRR